MKLETVIPKREAFKETKKEVTPKSPGFRIEDEDGKGRFATWDDVTLDVLEKVFKDRKTDPEKQRHFDRLMIWLVRKLELQNEESKAQIEALEKERGIDTLTGLPNAAEPRIDSLIKEMNFSGGRRESNLNAILVVALDINNFKVFNDEPNDHDVGNKALVAFADRLRASVKDKDLVCRPHSHGDEFIIVMALEHDPLTEDEIQGIFGRLEKDVNHDLKVAGNGGDLPITSSLGYSVLRKGENKSAMELILEADKKERRNKSKK